MQMPQDEKMPFVDEKIEIRPVWVEQSLEVGEKVGEDKAWMMNGFLSHGKEYNLSAMESFKQVSDMS